MRGRGVILLARALLGEGVGTFVSLLVSVYTPLFGFMESGYRLAVVLALVFDVLSTAFLSFFVVILAPPLARSIAGRSNVTKGLGQSGRAHG